jgi:L-amino acid N-acyltransferase
MTRAMASPTSYSIVPFADFYAQEVVAIYNREQEYGDSALHTAPLSPANCIQWLARGGERFGAHVYIRDDSVVGWTALIPFDSGSAYDYTAQFIVYVDHHMRKDGIGTQLLNEIIAMASECGFHSIVTLLPSEPAWRIGWLRRRGLQPCGQLSAVVRLRDKWLDLSVLQLILGKAND